MLELIYHERTTVTTIAHKHVPIIAGHVDVLTHELPVIAATQAYHDVHTGRVEILHTITIPEHDDLAWLRPSGLTSRVKDRFAAIKWAVLGAARWQERIADTVPEAMCDADVIAAFLAEHSLDAASEWKLVKPSAYTDTLLGMDDLPAEYWPEDQPSYRTTRQLGDVVLAA